MSRSVAILNCLIDRESALVVLRIVFAHKVDRSLSQRLNELIRQRGFRISAVAEEIGINRVTIGAWTDNAPIGKLFGISEFTSIPITEVIECFKPDPNLGANATLTSPLA